MGRKQLELSEKPKAIHFRKPQCGYTLIEVLTATVILSVGFLALASMTVTAIKRNAEANKITIATTLAQEKIEAVKYINYPDLISTNEDYGSVPNHDWFRREMIVTPDIPQANIKKVDVNVFIKDANGGDKILVAFSILKNK
ncbi:MAG: prepilin-type N-terminal cleavage/methylation domain-containing protein [Nitrospiria bacterium]